MREYIDVSFRGSGIQCLQTVFGTFGNTKENKINEKLIENTILRKNKWLSRTNIEFLLDFKSCQNDM